MTLHIRLPTLNDGSMEVVVQRGVEGICCAPVRRTLSISYGKRHANGV